MANPVLVEVTRGGRVESRHRGAVCVMDADGAVVLSLGDVDVPVYPRSAVKAFQALPLLETGAADRFGLSDAEIAQACASHSGEPLHVETSAAMLRKAGRDVSCLECGAHWPRDESARAMAAAGATPSALHNNCSGKHAGFVCVACGMDEDPAGYVRASHPVQVAVAQAVEDMTGAALDPIDCGTDGCSIPTYAIPLPALALGFARFGTGLGLPPVRAAAAARIRAAVAAHPWHVAGTGRLDTVVMGLLRARAFTKTGAEGVYCAALPGEGLGIALKCDDGSGRGAEVMLAALVDRFLPMDEAERAAMAALARPVLRNWNQIVVGNLQPAGPLA